MMTVLLPKWNASIENMH